MQTDLFEKQSSQSDELIALEDVFQAYFDCRISKRRTINALAFELDYEQRLIHLWQEINSGTYKIGRSIAFIVKHPVQREVFAADFRDRIVHHLIINKLNNLFEADFINSSYSCRQGKGTLFGVRDISKKIEECSQNYTQKCYVLKMDIRSFFMSIDKKILFRIISAFINQKYTKADKPILLRLIKQIVFYNPENNCIIKGSMADWNGLPCHKSLFWSERNRGLPIGNLTSQIFANVYLNLLDKFITEELNIPLYGRYVDDFILIHQDKNVLLKARNQIRIFLQTQLNLNLHPQKIYFQECQKGVRFIGAFIKPGRIYIGTRSKTNLYYHLNKILPLMAQSVKNTLDNLISLSSSINSYFGFMRHYNTYNLRTHILKLLDNSFLNEAIEIPPHSEKISITKLFRPHKRKQYQLRKQRQYRRYCRKNSLKHKE